MLYLFNHFISCPHFTIQQKMQNKCEEEHHQNLYLSSLLYKQVKILKNTASNTFNVVIPGPKKQKIVRNKTQLYIINDLNQDCVQNIKRKNSFIGCKKYRKVELESNQTRCTPYQSRKRHERLYIKLKKDKVSAQIDHLPLVLEESMAKWLVVKEARSSSSPQLMTQPSVERVKVFLDSDCQPNSLERNQETKLRVKTEGKVENEQQKCIRTLINSYKNKNTIKQNINKKKASSVSNQELKQSINLKLSTISQPKTETKIFSLKQKIRGIYVSKRQLASKRNKIIQDNGNTTQALNNNLLLSTHSDLTDKAPKSTLQGVLNSFKVDMKTKQLSRPKTASRLYKPSLTSHTKLPNKNASMNAIEAIGMTGWEEEPDRFDRDIFFS